MKDRREDINGQLELFIKVDSVLDELDIDTNEDHKSFDPRDDPFSPDYRSKVVCPIDDKYRYKKPS